MRRLTDERKYRRTIVKNIILVIRDLDLLRDFIPLSLLLLQMWNDYKMLSIRLPSVKIVLCVRDLEAFFQGWLKHRKILEDIVFKKMLISKMYQFIKMNHIIKNGVYFA